MIEFFGVGALLSNVSFDTPTGARLTSLEKVIDLVGVLPVFSMTGVIIQIGLVPSLSSDRACRRSRAESCSMSQTRGCQHCNLPW